MTSSHKLTEVQCYGDTFPSILSHSISRLNDHIYVIGGTVDGKTGVLPHKLEIEPGDKIKMTQLAVADDCDLPTFLVGHTVTCIGSQLLVFGGGDGTQTFNNLYIFDAEANNWSSPQTTGTAPQPRVGHSAAFYNDCVYFYGGFVAFVGYVNELHSINTKTMEWSQPTLNTSSLTKEQSEHVNGKTGHGACVLKNQMYVFGGNRQKILVDHFACIDLDNFNVNVPQTTGDLPPAHSYCQLLPIGKSEIALVGGTSDQENLINDFRVLNIDTFVWTRPSISSDGLPFPKLTRHCAFTYPNYHGTCDIYIFGGVEESPSSRMLRLSLNVDASSNSQTASQPQITILPNRHVIKTSGKSSPSPILMKVPIPPTPTAAPTGTSETTQTPNLNNSNPFVNFPNEYHLDVSPSHVEVEEANAAPPVTPQKEEEGSDGEEYSARARSVTRARSQPNKQKLEDRRKNAAKGEKPENIARNEWKEMALQKNPKIKHLKERISARDRTQAFCGLYKTQAWESLTQKMVFQIILQHLAVYNYHKTCVEFEKEAGYKSVIDTEKYNKSILQELLRSCVRDVNQLYTKILALSTIRPDRSPLANSRQHLSFSSDEETQLTVDELGKALHEQLSSMGIVTEEEIPDVSIYSEELSEKTLVMVEKDVKAGTLNQLVIMLTDTNEGGGSHEFLSTFLLTYRSFTTQKKLLEKLRERYHIPKPLGMSDQEFQKLKNVVHIKTMNFLTKFVQDSVSDFNQETITLLRDFLIDLKDQKSVVQKIEKILKTMGRKQMQAASLQLPEPLVTAQVCYPNFDLFSVDIVEVARQMTLLEFESYSKIKPSELLNLAWSKAKLRHRATNLVCMSERFNSISLWVTRSILDCERLKDRAARFIWFLKLLEQLRLLNNFQTLGGVYSGLTNSAIHRLTQTKAEIPKETMAILEDAAKLFSPDDNNKAIRNALDAAIPPCIPVITIYLSQITFTEEGNKTYTSEGLINFKKQSMISQIIHNIIKHQNEVYSFLSISQIRNFFVSLPPSPGEDEKKKKDALESQLYAKSRELEQRKK